MDAKENAAREAVKLIKEGQTVGLGTGSTANIFIKLLGERVRKEKLRIDCVPTSLASEKLAIECGLAVRSLGEVEKIDIDVDGADAVDEKLNAIKGLGGALTREKIVGYNADEFVIIVDEGKMKPLKGIVPIEVIPFACEQVRRELRKRGIKSEVRRKENGEPFITDNGNFILHAEMEVRDAEKMERELKLIPGVVENGIFTKVSKVIIGSEKGARVLKR